MESDFKNIFINSQGCCGMPQMEQGAVKEVANKAFNISNLLAQQIDHVEKSTGLPCHVCFVLLWFILCFSLIEWK